MKKALFTLTLFAFCIASPQNALAAPGKATKASKPSNSASKPSSSSNAGFGLNRLGVEAGLVDPEGVSGTVGFGGFADLGTVSPDIGLSSHLGYWSSSENQFGMEASLRDISIGARAKYMFRVASRKLQPYAGAGLGLHFFHTKVVVPDQDLGGFIVPGFTAEDSATKVGFDLGGGVATPLSPKTDLFADFWYTVADVDQVSLKAGVSFLLSR